MCGARAFPFSDRASKSKRSPGERESAGASRARRATKREGARASDQKGRRSASTLGEIFSESGKDPTHSCSTKLAARVA
ncbi:hypothetical protein NDU88_011095 [Pleurodeles waltl]|uniref:Uncharacterized protein n=1 Tax=Pleurodeles waltl TaxID=8319 RepID=A0AAV7S591_PLEWA|nr:hypothetical protein NDU88_011095 [Pleurodeles waltl]